MFSRLVMVDEFFRAGFRKELFHFQDSFLLARDFRGKNEKMGFQRNFRPGDNV